MADAVKVLRNRKVPPIKTISGKEYYVAVTETAERVIPADIRPHKEKPPPK